MKLTLEKSLLFVALFCLFSFILTLKIAGSSEIPNLVERDGFCKIVYGEDWKYSEDNFYCFLNKEVKTFTEDEFREICPKPNFISSKFFSDCFKKGDSRNI